MRRRPWTVAVALAGTLLGATAQAAKPVRVHALTGVRVVTEPGRSIEDATVVLRDGLIEAVGVGLAVPADARVWERKGWTVYAGLIDLYAPRASGEGKGAPLAQGAFPNALVHPERDIASAPPDAAWARKYREAGFTTVLAMPEDGLFRGQGAVVNLGDGPAPQAPLLRGAAQAVCIQPNTDGERSYPNSLMGAAALFRTVLLDAGWSREAEAAYAKNPRQARPALIPALESLEPALDRKQPLVFEAAELHDTLRAAALAREFNLKAWIVGSGKEYRRIDAVRQGAAPMILPLAFPKPPKLGDADDGTISLDELRHWDRAAGNPAAVFASGLPVALTAFRLEEPKRFWGQLKKSAEQGLNPEQALMALTTTPAVLLGLDRLLGTVAAGKLANLTLVEGELFVASPKIREVWIDGERYEIAEPSKDAKDSKNKDAATARGQAPREVTQ